MFFLSLHVHIRMQKRTLFSPKRLTSTSRVISVSKSTIFVSIVEKHAPLTVWIKLVAKLINTVQPTTTSWVTATAYFSTTRTSTATSTETHTYT